MSVTVVITNEDEARGLLRLAYQLAHSEEDSLVVLCAEEKDCAVVSDLIDFSSQSEKNPLLRIVSNSLESELKRTQDISSSPHFGYLKKEEIKTLSDAKTRCEEFNSSVCYINILLNEKLIWNVSSNQADSKIVNVITSELKTCESPYKNNVSKILKKYKFELKAKRVASFAEYWSQKDQKGRGIQREAVFDYVYVRSYC